jgi:hypothetical protein
MSFHVSAPKWLDFGDKNLVQEVDFGQYRFTIIPNAYKTYIELYIISQKMPHITITCPGSMQEWKQVCIMDITTSKHSRWTRGKHDSTLQCDWSLEQGN